MAVNTAVLLSLVAGQRVLLIDDDMNCGRVYLHLNIPTGQNTLLHLASDFMAAGNQLDGKMLRRRVLAADRSLDERTKVVQPKLDVLFGITDVEQASSEELRGKQGRLFMTSLLELAKRLYDFVIVDMGSNTQIGTHYGALASADMIIFVNSSDRTSLVPNRDTLNTLIRRASLQRDRFRLVLNRYDDRDRLGPKDIADYLEMPIAAVVPEDTSREMIASVNAGTPFVMTHMGKNNEASERTLRGLLDIAEEVYPPMGKIIAERGGRNKKGSRGWLRRN